MYLVVQIWWLLLLAFLLGALVGYLIWRTCALPRIEELNAARLADLEQENSSLKATAIAAPAAGAASAIPVVEAGLATPVEPERPAELVKPQAPVALSPLSSEPGRANGFLAAPRDGRPDNLKLVRGIGPRLEKILNAMGVFHFDQIAQWTPEDLLIVDAHLGDFAGRAVRDKWVEQSRVLSERARVREEAGDVPS